MIPAMTGPHLLVDYAEGFRSLKSLGWAPSLADPITFKVRAVKFTNLRDAIFALDGFLSSLTAVGESWFIESYRDDGYDNPKPSYPLSPSAVHGRFVAAPRFSDPNDIAERIAAYESLRAALTRPGLAISLLPLVDWVSLPLIRGWQRAKARVLYSADANDSLHNNFKIAMLEGRFAALRALRAPLLSPWLAGRYELRHPETFFTLHIGLPDELAYIALTVAGGNSTSLSVNDPILRPLVEEAAEFGVIRIESLGPFNLRVLRSRRVSVKIGLDEAMLLP